MYLVPLAEFGGKGYRWENGLDSYIANLPPNPLSQVRNIM
jgi:hypothetical protein